MTYFYQIIHKKRQISRMQLRFNLLVLCFGITCFSCRSIDHLADTKAKTIRVTNIAQDSSILALTSAYKANMDAKMNEVIAYVHEPMVKERPESTLTNWVADAIYNQAKKNFKQPIDFAYQNYGGIRIPTLAKGDLTVGKVFELMPFDNSLLVVKLNHEELLQFISYLAEIEGGPVSSNIKMIISNKKVESLLINGLPIENTKEYFVAMPDYIANGGDNQSYLSDNERLDKNILLRSVLIAEARDQKVVKSALDQRIIVKK